MKKQSVALSALCTIIFALSASGDLVRYTFEGTISSIEAYTFTNNALTDYSLPGNAFGHSLGERITYEFLVDKDLPATFPGTDTGTSPSWDGVSMCSSAWTAEYFSADYASGALIDESITGGNYQNRGSTIQFITTHLNGVIDTSRTISLAAENNEYLLTVYNNLDSIDLWGLNTLVQGNESFFSESGTPDARILTGTIICSNAMRITAIDTIRTQTSVPEPSLTMLLLVGGLMFFLFSVLRNRRTRLTSSR